MLLRMIPVTRAIECQWKTGESSHRCSFCQLETPFTTSKKIMLNAARRIFLWKEIADFSHALPKTLTDSWTDSQGVDQFIDRWKGHHSIAEGLKLLEHNDPSLGHGFHR